MKLVVESFDQLTQAYDEKVEENYLREVLDEVTLIPNLNKQQWAKVFKQLADLPKQLVIVKTLPIKQKEDYVLTHISTT